MEEQSIKFTLATIGNSNVGKSSILRRFFNNQFIESSAPPTVNMDYHESQLKINNQNIILQIWDTAGQELNFSLTRSYYRNIDAIILVYDVTEQKSLQDLDDKWIHQIKEYSDDEVMMLLVGNKIDLDYQQQALKQKVDLIADKLGCQVEWTSAKTGENVHQAIEGLTQRLLSQKMQKNNQNQQYESWNQDNFNRLKNGKSGVMRTNITPRDDDVRTLNSYVNKQSSVIDHDQSKLKINHNRKKQSKKGSDCCP